MDTNRCSWVVLLFVFYLQSATADTTVAPAAIPEGETPAAAVQPAETTAQVTAQVVNRSKVPVLISQKGRAQESVEPAKSYDSLSYPQVPINIKIPENSPIKYINVTGQQGVCTVPVCIYIQ